MPVAAPRPQAAAAPAAAPAAAGGAVACPQCGHVNATSNKFCASCGYNMTLVAAAPAAAAAPVAAGAAPGAVKLTALRADGSEAGSFVLPSNSMTVGRDIGGIFAGDSYLSPRHATFSSRGSKIFVKDEVSLNGVYVKLAPEAPVELQSSDVFRIGQEIIRFEVLAPQAPAADGVERLGSPSKGYVGRLSLLTGRDTTGNAYPVPENGIHIGRERGDILFPEDGYVSGLHCRIGWENGRAFLTDLGSSNGTFARLYAEREVHDNDVLLMGQQLFRVNF
jgi:pSer/pThr/pTyr-binding forkhead associated (FHA) protein